MYMCILDLENKILLKIILQYYYNMFFYFQ